MAIVVKFSTLAGGVFIEDNGTPDRSDADRCFDFDSGGGCSYAYYGELTRNVTLAKWHFTSYKAADFIFA